MFYRLAPRIAAVLFLLSSAANVNAEAYSLQPQDPNAETYVRQKMNSFAWMNDKTCIIYKNDVLHDMLDRVCLMCHEMFSHEQPELRVECRANCFKNKKFKQCLSIFAPPRQTRSVESRQWSYPEPMYGL
ncbi:hypothetical protein QR680_016268 [Steinernema hermaphroditum]|uniref:Uncharacterized protein n=1 Tax=Steinernema hermaphroditum TaxID=289476 RepID=A0AA39HAW5_9BILA|nr:hypothetical protein QR680_016268 [Steinernema hermaphroditum]